MADAIKHRARKGKRFSIVAVAEGAMTIKQATTVAALAERKEAAQTKSEKKKATRRKGETRRRAS